MVKFLASRLTPYWKLANAALGNKFKAGQYNKEQVEPLMLSHKMC